MILQTIPQLEKPLAAGARACCLREALGANCWCQPQPSRNRCSRTSQPSLEGLIKGLSRKQNQIKQKVIREKKSSPELRDQREGERGGIPQPRLPSPLPQPRELQPGAASSPTGSASSGWGAGDNTEVGLGEFFKRLKMLFFERVRKRRDSLCWRGVTRGARWLQVARGHRAGAVTHDFISSRPSVGITFRGLYFIDKYRCAHSCAWLSPGLASADGRVGAVLSRGGSRLRNSC